MSAVRTKGDGEKVEETLSYANGKVTFTLKADETMDLDVPACNFTITETTVRLKGTEAAENVTKHYSVAHTASAGNQTRSSGVSGTYALSNGGVVTIAYTNTWLRHLGDLVLQKVSSSVAAIDEHQSFIFDVVCENPTYGGPVGFTVVLNDRNNYKQEFIDLPLGTYTVTERQDWSWRYNNKTPQSVDVVIDGTDDVATFENVRTDSQWLNGSASKRNIFNAKN